MDTLPLTYVTQGMHLLSGLNTGGSSQCARRGIVLPVLRVAACLAAQFITMPPAQCCQKYEALDERLPCIAAWSCLCSAALARAMQLSAVQGLVRLAGRFPISDVRGRGLMVAAEFGSADGGLTAKAGVASAVTKACLARDMLLLTAGTCTALSLGSLVISRLPN